MTFEKFSEILEIFPFLKDFLKSYLGGSEGGEGRGGGAESFAQFSFIKTLVVARALISDQY